MTRQKDSPTDAPLAISGASRVLPYAAIAVVTLYCHWFILTNNEPIWDGWYWQYWLSHRRWEPMIEYTRAQGLPFTLWAFAPFAYVPHMIPVCLGASLLCLLADGILCYELARRLAGLPSGEALAISVLAQAMPLFSAAQDFPVFGLIVFRTLFLVAILLVSLALESKGVRHWWLRGAALVAFYFSCTTNGALIVFFGAAYLLFFARFRQLTGLSTSSAARRFVVRYPDLFFLPVVIFVARQILISQFGWYENYNKPGSNLDHLEDNFWSFFQNVIPYHLTATGAWFLQHPFLTLALLAGIAAWFWRAPQRWSIGKGSLSTWHLLWFGSAALFLAVFPLAAGGKYFEARPVGEASRHCMLAGWPLAILLFAGLRLAFFAQGRRSSRLLPAIVGAMVVIFGSQYLPIYLTERVESIFSRSLLHQAGKSEVVRDSSIIYVGKLNAVRQMFYGTCAFASEFGELTRLASPIAPPNGRFYLPGDVEWHLFRTTIVPNEFRRIDPSGRQTLLEVNRGRDVPNDWELAMRHWRLRWFGSADDLDRYLSSLTTLTTTIVREATPMETSSAPVAPSAESPHPSEVSGDFTNAAGLEMVSLPWGSWAAKYETTQAQFERVMGSQPSLFRDPMRPVDSVSWDEATEFCRRVTALEAKRLPSSYAYRLPTVEEFERLLKGSGAQQAILGIPDGPWQTAPVGSLPPDRLKLHDVIGNVWEWAQDFWDEDHRFRVSMGGAFSNQAMQMVSHKTVRHDVMDRRNWLMKAADERLYGPIRWDYPEQRFWNRGFRCVLAPAAIKIDKPVRKRATLEL